MLFLIWKVNRLFRSRLLGSFHQEQVGATVKREVIPYDSAVTLVNFVTLRMRLLVLDGEGTVFGSLCNRGKKRV
jgi:hypothetical protein